MKDPARLTNITLVIYPSNHVLKYSPKIVLLGSGSAWKDELIRLTAETWGVCPISFYYYDGENYDSDILSWIYLNLNQADFLIGNIQNQVDESVILPFIKDEKTFIIISNSADYVFNDWFRTLNPNKETVTLNSIILKLQQLYNNYIINTAGKPIAMERFT